MTCCEIGRCGESRYNAAVGRSVVPARRVVAGRLEHLMDNRTPWA